MAHSMAHKRKLQCMSLREKMNELLDHLKSIQNTTNSELSKKVAKFYHIQRDSRSCPTMRRAWRETLVWLGELVRLKAWYSRFMRLPESACHRPTQVPKRDSFLPRTSRGLD